MYIVSGCDWYVECLECLDDCWHDTDDFCLSCFRALEIIHVYLFIYLLVPVCCETTRDKAEGP